MTAEQQIKQFEHYWPQYVNYLAECVAAKHTPKTFSFFTVNQFDSLLRYKQTGNLINPNPPVFHEGPDVVWMTIGEIKDKAGLSDEQIQMIDDIVGLTPLQIINHHKQTGEMLI